MKVRKIGIVGRGLIGSSWALVFARSGHLVRIWLRNEADGQTAMEAIEKARSVLVGTGLEGDEATLTRISVHASFDEALEGVDYVQESVLEDISLKQDILSRIEAAAPASAIIGSSTSGIVPSLLAEGLTRPERFMVVHPLTPPHLLPVTELCAAPQTSMETIGAVTELLKQVGQHPVHLHKEIPGFALNRILGAMMNECFALIEDGVISPKDIDPLFTEGFGLRWGLIGPLAAMDLNAPGGIEDYLTRYGGIYARVAQSRGARPVLTDDLIGRIGASMRQHLGEEDREKRATRRDSAIARFRQSRSR